MEEAKVLIRRVLLLKFKPGTAPDLIDQLIKDYANLVNLIESLKSWQMGKDLHFLNLDGFKHVVELTFESDEGSAEYSDHPAHLEFHERIMPHMEELLVIDYKPTPFGT